MTWLYRVADGEAVLFNDAKEVNEKLASKEWAESPADCNCNHSCEGEGIGEIAIEDYQGLTVDDFKKRFTIEEMRAIGKELGISLKGKRTEDQIAQMLVDSLTK